MVSCFCTVTKKSASLRHVSQYCVVVKKSNFKQNFHSDCILSETKRSKCPFLVKKYPFGLSFHKVDNALIYRSTPKKKNGKTHGWIFQDFQKKPMKVKYDFPVNGPFVPSWSGWESCSRWFVPCILDMWWNHVTP